MRILVVAATAMEIAPLVARLRHRSAGSLRVKSYAHAAHDIDVLITGVGMVATAAWCSHVLASPRYDLALNLGLCGSFDRALEPGTVVHVRSDRLAELGAEDDDAFLTVQQLQLLGDDEFPFTGGQLVNPAPPDNAAIGRLPDVESITVNTVHGNPRSIADVARRFKPQVESMEGAAFMYACMIRGLVHAQVRSVSNFVEKRNRAAWKIGDAIRSLEHAALSILDHA
ncbi:MAG: futalosine hydrolase [Acidobacteriota bacterium]